MTYFFLKNFVLGPILRLLFRPWSRGPNTFPKVVVQFWLQPFIFVDSIFLPLKLRRPVTFWPERVLHR